MKNRLQGEGPGAMEYTPSSGDPLSNFTRESLAWRDRYVGNVIAFFKSHRRPKSPRYPGSGYGQGEGTGHRVFRKTNNRKG